MRVSTYKPFRTRVFALWRFSNVVLLTIMEDDFTWTTLRLRGERYNYFVRGKHRQGEHILHLCCLSHYHIHPRFHGLGKLLTKMKLTTALLLQVVRSKRKHNHETCVDVKKKGKKEILTCFWSTHTSAPCSRWTRLVHKHTE